MKVFYFICFLIVSIVCEAQLYVSPNSYVFVNDQYVTVTQAVNLAASNSNIYLRNNGQLVQKTTGVGANVGDGALSVYQEGTVNNYCYNYWSSPVGGANTTAGNSNFSIAQLGLPNLNLDTRSFAFASILPFTNYDGVSTNGAVSIASQWIWKYIQRSAYDPGGPNGWARASATNALAPGEGFTMKGTSGSDSFTPFTGSGANNLSGNGQRYDFRGKPNDGTITVPVDVGKFTLIGNPYPSAIDLRILLFRSPGLNGVFGDGDDGPIENPNIDGTALFWEHDKSVNSHLIASYKGGYGIYNGASDVYTPAVYISYDSAGNVGTASTPLNTNIGVNAFKRRFTPIGQGFMVNGTANATVSIKNAYRVFVKEAVLANSQFERVAGNTDRQLTANFYPEIPNNAGLDYTLQSTLQTPHIKIRTMLPNGAVRQNDLVFIESAQDGYDRADSKSPDASSNLAADAYFPVDNSEYVQSAVAFDINKRIPFAFKNTATSNFRIRVGEMVNFTGTNEVFLHDKQLDTYHDILNSDFNLNLPIGLYNNRFEITFKNNNALAVNTTEIAENFKIFQNNTNSLLTIKNPLGIDIKSCEMYDLAGKVVISKNNVGSDLSFQYSTASFSEGIYIVKLVTTNLNTIVEKVLLSNKK